MHLRPRWDRRIGHCWNDWNPCLVKDLSSSWCSKWDIVKFSVKAAIFVIYSPCPPTSFFLLPPLPLDLFIHCPLFPVAYFLITTLPDMAIFFFAKWTNATNSSRRSKTSHTQSCLRQDMKGHHGDQTIHSQRGLVLCWQSSSRWKKKTNTPKNPMAETWDSIKNVDHIMTGH